MKSVRLLPVVIFAGLALLVFKGIGLLTNGGYVLTGATTVQAAGSGDDAGGANDATMTLPAEPTLSDPSPTLNDTAPVLPLPANSPGHGEEGADEHGAEPAAAAPGCTPRSDAGEGERGAESTGHGDTVQGFDLARDADGCPVDPGMDAAGDSLPLIKNGAGNIVPMAGGASGSEQAVLERLGERRETLNAREAELAMRMALVEAAERRIEERTVALGVIEARINAMVEEKKAMDEGQFASIVAMYEMMKPKEAAAILDQLEMPILLRVARAMSPRKMAPIMARMEPRKAKDLTAGMALEQTAATIEFTAEDLGALPQIIGQ